MTSPPATALVLFVAIASARVKESLDLAGYRAYTQNYDGELYLVPKSR